MFDNCLTSKISTALILLLLLCSCGNKNNKSVLNGNLYALSLDKSTLNTKPLEEYPSKFNGYIYIMNSECSTCIGNFISFAKDLDMNGYRDSVLAIISIATQPIVNHYVKKYAFSKRIKIIFSENIKEKWGINSIEEENGLVYYLKNNQIETVYQYFPHE